MIRRALTLILAAAALTLGLAGCSNDNDTKDTAVKFVTAYVSGDEAGACKLAAKKIGDCTTRPANDITDGPTAEDEVFENKDTGTVAVIVTYTVAKKPGDPDTYAVELNKDGKVTQWKPMSNQPKNRNTVAMVLGWSK